MVRQSLEQSLQQKLFPQQIQLMKLIELSTLELEQKVKDEIETNPALDNDNLQPDSLESDNNESEFGENDSMSENERDFDIDQYISDDEIPHYKLHSNNTSEDDNNESIPIVGGHTHLDMLQQQLFEVKLDEKAKIIAEYIIGCIDEDGYIRRSVEEIIDDLIFKENLICEKKEIKKILLLVQNFDPPGIGAYDLQECLLLQLNRKDQTEDVILATSVIKNSFKQFVNKHYQKICDRFKVSSDNLKKRFAYLGPEFTNDEIEEYLNLVRSHTPEHRVMNQYFSY